MSLPLPTAAIDSRRRYCNCQSKYIRGLPNAEDFENSASASAAEGFKPLNRRSSHRFDSMDLVHTTYLCLNPNLIPRGEIFLKDRAVEKSEILAWQAIAHLSSFI